MLRICFLALVTLWAGAGFAQTVIQVAVPPETPEDASIFLAGDFNGWQPADPDFQFIRVQTGHYQLVTRITGEVEAKLTQGAWEMVEVQPSGQDLANRNLQFVRGDTVKLTVAAWRGDHEQLSKASPNVRVIDSLFTIPGLDRPRRIRIYLPPGYDSSGEGYPVVYFHDGQNVFDVKTAYAGEWRVDEILDSLATSEHPLRLIAVAIDNGGEFRMKEYSPWVHPYYGGGEGDAYLDFVAEVVKPWIDEHFTTLPDPAHTAMVGSSMGGLITHAMALRHPGVFGRLGIFSPSYWFSVQVYRDTEAQQLMGIHRLYLMTGGLEGENMVKGTRDMADLLMDQGMEGDQLAMRIVVDGEHKEWFWARELPEVLRWLFAE